MGANHARVLNESARASLEMVIDDDLDRASHLANRYGAKASRTLDLLDTCDAVVVASSTQSHFSIARTVLERQLPVLVEKPLAMALDECEQLRSIALKKCVPLVCGFVERFNPVIDTATELLDDEVHHVVTMRHSPVTPRMSDSVIYDLLIHDIDLAALFTRSHSVVKVGGVAWAPPGQTTIEVADCNLQFDTGAVATLSASRAGQRKLRAIQLFTHSTLVELDLLRADVTVFRNVRQEQPDDTKALTYRAETIIDIPFVRHAGEPLARQLDHFLDLAIDPSGLQDELDGIIATHEIAKQIDMACHPESDDYGSVKTDIR